MITHEDIQGWFYYRDFYDMLLESIPDEGSVVEVGVFYGKGLVYLAQSPIAARKRLRIYGVDRFTPGLMPYVGSEIKTDADFYEKCLGNLFAAGVERMVTLISLESVRASLLFKDGSLDCAFIDAEHDELPVTIDINTWKPKVKPGGFLAGDDYNTSFGGVIAAVDRLLPGRVIMGSKEWPNWHIRM